MIGASAYYPKEPLNKLPLLGDGAAISERFRKRKLHRVWSLWPAERLLPPIPPKKFDAFLIYKIEYSRNTGVLAHKRNQVKILSKAVTVFSDEVHGAISHWRNLGRRACVGNPNSYQPEYLPVFYSKTNEYCRVFCGFLEAGWWHGVKRKLYLLLLCNLCAHYRLELRFRG